MSDHVYVEPGQLREFSAALRKHAETLRGAGTPTQPATSVRSVLAGSSVASAAATLGDVNAATDDGFIVDDTGGVQPGPTLADDPQAPVVAAGTPQPSAPD